MGTLGYFNSTQFATDGFGNALGSAAGQDALAPSPVVTTTNMNLDVLQELPEQVAPDVSALVEPQEIEPELPEVTASVSMDTSLLDELPTERNPIDVSDLPEPGTVLNPTGTGSVEPLLPQMMLAGGFSPVSEGGADAILAEMGQQNAQRVADDAAEIPSGNQLLDGMSQSVTMLQNTYFAQSGDSAWQIAASQNPGADNATINSYKNQLLTANPWLGNDNLQVGDPVILPSADTPEATNRAVALDGQFASIQQQKIADFLNTPLTDDQMQSLFGSSQGTVPKIDIPIGESGMPLDMELTDRGLNFLMGNGFSTSVETKINGITWSPVNPSGQPAGGDYLWAYDSGGNYLGMKQTNGIQDDSGGLLLMAGATNLLASGVGAAADAVDGYLTRSLDSTFGSGFKLAGSDAVPPTSLSNFSYTINSIPTGLVQDSSGVYGYMPAAGSRFSFENWGVDWTNPTQVSGAQVTRLDYMQSESDFIQNLQNAGLSDDNLASSLVDFRNQLRLSYYTEDELPAVFTKNIDDYGNPNGPTYEQQLQKYGTPQAVIQAGQRTNTAMDVLTGIATPVLGEQ